MKAMILADVNKAEFHDLPVPTIKEDEVLIRNTFCAICNATDTKMLTGKHSLIAYPSVIGHEGAGIVEKIGSAVKTIQVGEAVLGAGYPSTDKLGSFWGHYSEYGVTSENRVTRIPDNVSAEHACCSHMLAEALNAVRIAGVKPGDTVAIIGAGAVGLSILTMVKHMMPFSIIVIDVSDEKRKKALQFGADAALNPDENDLVSLINTATNGKGINILFEAVGIPKTYELAYELLNPNGILIPFGLIEGTLELPFRKLYSKQIQVRWVRAAGTNETENKLLTLRMMSHGLIKATDLITSIRPMEEFVQATESIRQGNEIRVVLKI